MATKNVPIKTAKGLNTDSLVKASEQSYHRNKLRASMMKATLRDEVSRITKNNPGKPVQDNQIPSKKAGVKVPTPKFSPSFPKSSVKRNGGTVSKSSKKK